ncbi:FAD/NAD-P-binding domain-containing protein [Lyophyllum atratum]|nr:FAD/NAD-P-binding domain-containing protein [Lyophyllum atratum]
MSSALQTKTVGIIGAGAAGLITAQVLLQDGFNVRVITRDKSPGGVWARERIYPGLSINNVHGEFRFSSLPMPPPSQSAETGGRLAGDDMCTYMETFAHTFLNSKITFETEVLAIYRSASGLWLVTVEGRGSATQQVFEFSHIVLCTGGCSSPNIPKHLSPATAERARFRGLVFHSANFRDHVDEVLEKVKPIAPGGNGDGDSIVVIGGGKSAQDTAAYLANAGRKVTVVFETTDAILAVPKPLPAFIRKSRFLGILSPHIELKTRLERFLHTTWLGSKIVHFIWDKITSSSLDVYSIPKDSPLRNAHSLFWGIRTNDEGAYRANSFYGLVSFGSDGRSLILSNGQTLPADVVILATGYTSSWTNIFDDETTEALGIGRHPPLTKVVDTWNYTSLANPPSSHPDNEQWASSIYRGLVPAKNLDQRDFAINGAVFTTNNGYSFEVSAHWISSYFLRDQMRLPSSTEEALAHAERNSAWMRKRFPDMLLWVNESYSSGLAFWSWPQLVDDLLEDMHLPSMRSWWQTG